MKLFDRLLPWGATRALALFSAVVLIGGLAGAQDRPERDSSAAAPSAWQATVAALAGALSDPAESGSVQILVAPDAIIRGFSSPQRESLESLHTATSGMTLLAARGYPETPSSMAGDIAADIRDAAIPDPVKRALTPSGEAEARRANVTAVRWISTTLNPSEGEPVGVIVFWGAEPGDATAGEEALAKRAPMFLLVKGRALEQGGFIVRMICYGNPIPLTENAGLDKPAEGR
jgi:hypothetical protein